MLIVLSPAKTLDFTKTIHIKEHSEPVFINEAEMLVNKLQKLKPADLSSLMSISAKLADLNFERFIKWEKNHSQEHTKPSVFAFKGDVYVGLDVDSLSEENLNFLNRNTRILSGLYGILKPFDLIREYRLEMGAKLKNPKGADLYKFWGNKITKQVNEAIAASDGEKVLINLASNEYFKSIDKKELKFPVITPVFKEFKDDGYKIVSFFAKKARGMMTRYIARENIQKAEDIKSFNLDGYVFNQELSKAKEWVFTR
ncbi:MAG: peroxide stress protein YaaA [Bacteroidales bacterium]|nr:peroxide stress protein YaaA [Bacteroidales bacterium]